MSLSHSKIKRIAHKTLAQASVGDLRVKVSASRVGNARFAASGPTTGGDVERLMVSVTAVTPDGRMATAQGNQTDDAALAGLVRAAEQMASQVPIDPETMPPLGKTKLVRVANFDRKVAQMDAAQRIELVRSTISGAGQTSISGFIEHRDSAVYHADRAGLGGYHRQSALSMSCTCRTADHTGSAKRGFLSHTAHGLEGRVLAVDCAQWAQRSRSPKAIDPGRYTVVLAPQAVADLLLFFVGAMSHRKAVEGRSYFAGKQGGTRLGETLFGPNIHLRSDPADREHPATPMAADGTAQVATTWVEAGQLRALQAGRYWADKTGVAVRPVPSSVHMAGTTTTLDQLIEGVDRGILVSRFWYNRMLAPRTITTTGLTRDGTFWIEKGKIVQPIGNLRYNDSPVTLLKKALALGQAQRAGLTQGTVVVVPPVVVDGFRFESRSEAI